MTEQSDVEAQLQITPSSRRSVRRHESRRDRQSPTGSRKQSPSRSRSRSPHKTKAEETGRGGITRTLSGLFSSAQEAIGANWAAATAETHASSTSDSEEYLSVNDSHPTASTDYSRKNGDRARDKEPLTGTRRTSVKRRRNSSSSTSTSSLEDYPDTKKPGTAEPSADDDCIWESIKTLVPIYL